MLDTIKFSNYKSFKGIAKLDLKPITILIGKNSSGKSAIAKLPTLISHSLKGKSNEAVKSNSSGIELGKEFRDLTYGRYFTTSLKFKLHKGKNFLDVEVASGSKMFDFAKVVKWNFNDNHLINYMHKEDQYSYNNRSYASSLFKGFIPEHINSDLKFDEKISINVNYIGPFRTIPERVITQDSLTYNNVGKDGEFVYQMLIDDLIYNESKIINEINQWYQLNFEGWYIVLNTTNFPDVSFHLKRDKPEFTINIRDVGEGITQVLPILFSAIAYRDKEILTIIEQPELHIHPAAHGSIAEFLATSSSKNGQRFLVETHSENFILRIRRLIAENKIDSKFVQLYYVDYNSKDNYSKLVEINIDSKGNVDFWPEGVFSESLEEVKALREAQLNSDAD